MESFSRLVDFVLGDVDANDGVAGEIMKKPDTVSSPMEMLHDEGGIVVLAESACGVDEAMARMGRAWRAGLRTRRCLVAWTFSWRGQRRWRILRSGRGGAG